MKKENRSKVIINIIVLNTEILGALLAFFWKTCSKIPFMAKECFPDPERLFVCFLKKWLWHFLRLSDILENNTKVFYSVSCSPNMYLVSISYCGDKLINKAQSLTNRDV